jgi:2,5-dihydroxypyridine 5,6-dioxygenase
MPCAKSGVLMLVERCEPQWVDAMEHVLRLCAVQPRQTAAILCETQSRRVLIELAKLACARLDVHGFELCVATPAAKHAMPVRSTGASTALQGNIAVIGALAASQLVIDCTVEGLLHAPELPKILAGGARVLMVSNEHPEILRRCLPQASDEQPVRNAMRLLRGAKRMHVTSSSGTDLKINLAGAKVGGTYGFCTKPGQIAHWPGSLALAFPAQGCVNGMLVLAPGDVNLTFKEYLRDPVRLQIADDQIMAIDGTGADVDLLRGHWAAWEALEGSRACYCASHVGFGLNTQARWDSLMFYDKRDCNGTELRAIAGNFLYSTGANEVAGRFTEGHFDLPMRGCTIMLDDTIVVKEGELV